METPLNKVVFIQKVATFAARSLREVIQLAFVNNSWSDTVQNFGTTSVDELVRASHTTFSRAQKRGVKWVMSLILSKSFLILNDSCLRLTCLNKEPKEIEFILERIGKAGGPDVLKNQLTATDSEGKNCLMSLCRQNSSSEKIKLIVDASLEVDSSKELLKTLLSATDKYGRSCLLLLCINSSSTLEIIQLVLNLIFEAGGPDLLRLQLSAANKYRTTFLLGICSSRLMSFEVISLILNTIFKTGGRDLLYSQLAATDEYGNNCIMLMCKNYSTPEVLNLFFEKIIEVGEEGPKLLSTQLAATSTNDHANCLMSCASRSSASIEVIKLLLDKSVEVGGTKFLTTQLTATDEDGLNCLMRICSLSSSSPSLVEKLRLILRKIVEADETAELLKNQLTATTKNGSTCFMLCCKSSSSSPEVMKLIAALLHHFDLFKTQYEQLPEYRVETVEEDLCNIDYPDQQYKTVESGPNYEGHLRDTAKIKSASWSPDKKDVADVKGILNGTEHVQTTTSSPSPRHE